MGSSLPWTDGPCLGPVAVAGLVAKLEQYNKPGQAHALLKKKSWCSQKKKSWHAMSGLQFDYSFL